MIRKTTSAAIALAMIATIAGAATPAAAGGKEAGAFIGGLLLGGALNAQRPVYAQPPVYVQPAPVYVQPAPVYVQPGYSAHQQWCLQRYRSYNPSTNIYFIRRGVPAYCNSPYG